jgi:hypothetical protein
MLIKEDLTEDQKTQPSPEKKQLQPVQVIEGADGWIAVLKKSVHFGSGEFPWEVKES